MDKDMRKFHRYYDKVVKTKNLQEEANSSGSEDYKLWRKRRFNKYIRVELKADNDYLDQDLG